jgi:hypothetical protein
LVETDDEVNDYELEGKQVRHTVARCTRDRGCYASKSEPCVGYLGSGCRNCGRIITLTLIEQGDARFA